MEPAAPRRRRRARLARVRSASGSSCCAGRHADPGRGDEGAVRVRATGATAASTACSATRTSCRCWAPSSSRAAGSPSSSRARDDRRRTATSTRCSRCTHADRRLGLGHRRTATFFAANAALLWLCAAAIAVCLYAAGRPPRAVVRAGADVARLRARELGPVRGGARDRRAVPPSSCRRDVLAGRPARARRVREVLSGDAGRAAHRPAAAGPRARPRDPAGLGGRRDLARREPAVRIASPSAWSTFFRFNSAALRRLRQPLVIGVRARSTSRAICRTPTPDQLASVALFLGLFVLVWMAKARRVARLPAVDARRSRCSSCFLLTNKVYSPQYGLWLLPLFALALPDLRAFVAFAVADVAVFVTRFWWFGHLEGRSLPADRTSCGRSTHGSERAAMDVRARRGGAGARSLVWCVVAVDPPRARDPRRRAPAAAVAGARGARVTAGPSLRRRGPLLRLWCSWALRVGRSRCCRCSASAWCRCSRPGSTCPGWPAPIDHPGLAQPVRRAIERQDALWFLRIADTGYRPGDGSAAFFPLYPLLVRVMSLAHRRTDARWRGAPGLQRVVPGRADRAVRPHDPRVLRGARAARR